MIRVLILVSLATAAGCSSPKPNSDKKSEVKSQSAEAIAIGADGTQLLLGSWSTCRSYDLEYQGPSTKAKHSELLTYVFQEDGKGEAITRRFEGRDCRVAFTQESAIRALGGPFAEGCIFEDQVLNSEVEGESPKSAQEESERQNAEIAKQNECQLKYTYKSEIKKLMVSDSEPMTFIYTPTKEGSAAAVDIKGTQYWKSGSYKIEKGTLSFTDPCLRYDPNGPSLYLDVRQPTTNVLLPGCNEDGSGRSTDFTSAEVFIRN